MEKTESGKGLGSLAGGDAPVLETLAQMTLDTLPRSGLDARSYFLVRIAGLAALDAAPISYLVNTAAASDVLQPKDLQGILIALAPVIGSARTVAAAGNMLKAFATAMDVQDMLREAEEKEEQLKKH